MKYAHSDNFSEINSSIFIDYIHDITEYLSFDRHYSQNNAHSRIIAIREKGPLPDSAKIYSIGDKYILLMSPFEFPDVMEEHFHSIECMREQISPEAAKAIPPIFAAGRIREVSFIVFARCTSLRTSPFWGRIDRARFANKLLAWLREFSEKTGEPTEEARRNFIKAVNNLVKMPELSKGIRVAAQVVSSKITSGEFEPFHIPMHGDLWHGNIMRQKDGSLAVIDWGGSAAEGYGVFDLIRASQSFKLGKKRVRRELIWYRSLLGMGAAGPTVHLLGALGHLAGQLGEFPKERFCFMADQCYDSLRNYKISSL